MFEGWIELMCEFYVEKKLKPELKVFKSLYMYACVMLKDVGYPKYVRSISLFGK